MVLISVKDLLNDLIKTTFKGQTSESIDFTELFASLILRQSLPFFDIGLDVDPQDSTLVFQVIFYLKNFSLIHNLIAEFT